MDPSQGLSAIASPLMTTALTLARPRRRASTADRSVTAPDRTAHIHCSHPSTIARKKFTGRRTRPRRKSLYVVSRDDVNGTSTIRSRRTLLIHMPALSMRTIHSNWRTCVIHITHRMRKLMTNEKSGWPRSRRPVTRSSSVRTVPSD